jgi:predicted kinase
MHQQVSLNILCGLPFSGKTTLTRELVRLLGWGYISMDSINDERQLVRDGVRITRWQWEETYGEMYSRLRAALLRGETVVLDAPSFTKQQRREVEQIGIECASDSRSIYVRVEEAKARWRWQNNRRSTERHDVRDDDFELVISNFEPPDESEDPLVFDSTTNPAGWIRSTFL